MRILLLCAAGMSSSLVVFKMRNKLTDEQKDWIIEAEPTENVAKVIGDYDVVLLGPQMKHKLERLKSSYPNKPIAVIAAEDYAKDDGSNLLKQAIKLLSSIG